MFVLPRKQNPLNQMLGEALGTAVHSGVQSHLMNEREQKKNAELQSVFEGINEETSPLELMKRIESLRYADPETKKSLYEGFGQVQKERTKKLEESNIERKNANEVAAIEKNFGLEAGTLKGLDPKRAMEAVKEIKKGKRIEDLLGTINPKAQPEQVKKTQAKPTLGISKPELLNEVEKSYTGDETPQEQADVPKNQQPNKPRISQRFSPEALMALSIENPSTANAIQRQIEFEQRNDIAWNEIENKNKLADRKEKNEYHKESQAFDDDLSTKNERASSQLSALQDVDKAIKNISPSSIANVFKGTGILGDKIANAFLSGDEAKILGSIPYLIEGWKDVFGVRLSDADLRVIQDKLPDIGKSEEANRAIVSIMKKYAAMTKLKWQIGREIKKENKNLRPLGYRDMVEDRFQEQIKPVMMIPPGKTKAIPIPAYQVSEAIKSGAKLANE